MSQLVRKLLKMIRLQSRVVLNDVVTRGVHSALPDGLGYQKEVIPLWKRNNIINNRSARGIRGLPSHLEKSCIYPLRYNYVREENILRQSGRLKAILDGTNFMLNDVWNLTITNTIPRR